MVRRGTTLDGLVQTSATLNGLAIPGRSLETALARHAFNLFVNHADGTYKVLLRGSGTAIEYKGRRLLLCTQHQLDGIDRQNVGMLADDGSILVTSGGMRHYHPSTETDAYDLVAFDFTEATAYYPLFKKRFFPLHRIPPYVPFNDVVGFNLTGFPFADQNYDVGETNHIGIGRRQVLCTLDPEVPADDVLLRLKPREPLDFDPDGMSGGSAFVIQVVDGVFCVDFAGIIVRGGRTDSTSSRRDRC